MVLKYFKIGAKLKFILSVYSLCFIVQQLDYVNIYSPIVTDLIRAY